MIKRIIAWFKQLFQKNQLPLIYQPNIFITPPPTHSPEAGIPGSLQWYGYWYDEAHIVDNETRRGILTRICDDIESNKNRYLAVEKVTNVPWNLVGALHYRECGLSFNKYFGNGDPLERVSIHVPAGRGPFATWELGAVDALKLGSLGDIANWTLPMMLKHAEAYNGLGYLRYHPAILSPYIWSFTTLYSKGKYAADGKWDPELVDAQIGVAAILMELKLRGAI